MLDEFFVAAFEDPLDLNMAPGEIVIDALELAIDVFLVEPRDLLEQPLGAARLRSMRLPGKMERTDDDPARIGTQAYGMMIDENRSLPSPRQE